jgi:hypothetical protein
MTAHPKPAKPERGTKACREWMGLVAQIPCVICGDPGVQLHHCAHGRYSRTRASDFDVIPLCPKHHQFRTDHGETWATMYGFDTDYLPIVKRAVERLQAMTI